MRKRAFSRRAVRRFMPGEEASNALAAAAAQPERIGAILTQLGENIDNAAAAAAVRDHYEGVLDQIAAQHLRAEISVKLTQLGLDLDQQTCSDHVTALAAHAGPHGSRVWIDIEDSSYVDVTLQTFRRVRERHENVGLCLQSYLYRTVDDLEALLPLNPAIRLVKGAYNEPAAVAFPKKQDVDRNYLEIGTRLIAHAANGGTPPVFGTHDMRLATALQQRAGEHGLAKAACEIHMLYGIGTADQRQLAAEGYGVRVLISYGSAWFPWYMRRLAERPANVWFVVKSVFR